MKFFLKKNKVWPINYKNFKTVIYCDSNKFFLKKNLFNDYLNFFFKNGLKKKIKLQLLKSFNFFFLFFYNNNNVWENFQKNINILKNSFFLNYNFFHINLILEFLVNFLNPIFDFLCYNRPKTYKKKSKLGFFFKLKYLNYSVRKKRSLKWLYLYSLNFSDRLFFKKIFKSIFFTFIEGKNSFLYKKKIQIYKKTIKLF